MLDLKRTASCTALIAIVAGLAGCGSGEELPELAPVSGTVTLDGAPLAGALVQFAPTGAGASFGTTNQDGRYELQFSSAHTGAAVGAHVVRIRHYGNDPEVPQEGLIPARYNDATTLKAEVKPEENTIDFDLQSERSR